MRRRDFLFAVGSAAVALPLGARAQQAIPLIGFLRSTSAAGSAHLVAAFQQGLKERGLVEGQNIAIDYRWGDGHLDRLPELATDLVHRQPTVIVANNLGARAAMAATTTIPIVFVGSSDPVRIGLVASFNRPGGNVTGVVFTSADLTTKQLDILHRLVPKSVVLAALFDPDSPTLEHRIEEAKKASRILERQLLILKASNDGELRDAFEAIVQRGAGGLLISGGAFFVSRHRQLAALATRHALPTIGFNPSFADAGVLMSYGASQVHAYRRAGDYVSRILKGAKPASMPVERSVKLEFVINLATAKAINLEIPPNLIALADKVIE